LKIALFYYDLLDCGGGPRHLLSLAKHLQLLGNLVTVYAYEYSPRRCFPEICSSLDVRYVKEVGRELRARSSKPKQLFKYFLGTRRLANRVKEDYDILNPHGWPAHRAAVIVKRRRNTPIVWTFHDPSRWDVKPGNPFEKAFKKIEDSIVKEIDGILVFDNGVKRAVIRSYGVEPKVLRSGIDLELFQSEKKGDEVRKGHGITNKSFLALCVGVLSRHRRTEDAIEAVGILHRKGLNVRLIIVGSPQRAPGYADYLQGVVKLKGLSGIVTLVFDDVSEVELLGYYGACDVLVYPNENQTWGLAPLEAMACGKPTIVSRGAGVHEVLEDGETAMLVPPRRPDLIARKMEELIRNEELRKEIAERGREFVTRSFSWEKCARRMLSVFEEAISKD